MQDIKRTKYRRFCRRKKRRNARGRTAQVRSPSRHTSQQLSTAAAGVAADVEVVPVAAAGDAVAGGRSSASSSSLVDSLWCHID